MSNFENLMPDEAGYAFVDERRTPVFSDEMRESEFWNSPPRYSTTGLQPVAVFSLPRARPSRPRRVLATLLFLALFSAVLALLAYEASVVFGFSWASVLNGQI